jgi:uncharacterized membrane protein
MFSFNNRPASAINTRRSKANPGFKRWIAAVAVALIVMGAGLRLIHLPTAILGGDEVYSALRISGNSFEQAYAELADGHAHPASQWQAHLSPQPGSSWRGTVRALAQEAPEHPPLFYLLSRQWQRWLGSTNLERRLLPALIALALIPAMALLAFELWKSTWIALCTALLISVSPFHILYAKELREYSLWSVLIAISAWLLAKALERNSLLSWLAYGLTLAALLYTHLFSLPLAIAWAALALLKPWRSRLPGLWLSTGLALLSYAPWLWMAGQGSMLRRGTNLWTAETLSWPLLVWNWGLNASRIWLDLDPGGRLIGGDSVWATGLRALAVLAAALAALACLLRLSRLPQPAAQAIVFSMLASSTLPLVAADLLLGGSRSAIARYQIPAYLALTLVVAWGLVQLGRQHRSLALILATVLISLNLSSSWHALAAPGWWSKQGSLDQPLIASVIEEFDRPLVVAEGYLPRLLSLSSALNGAVGLQILKDPQKLDPAPCGYSDVLLYRPTQRWHGIPAQRLLTTANRFPYLPAVSAHSRIWLSAVDRSPAEADESRSVSSENQDSCVRQATP